MSAQGCVPREGGDWPGVCLARGCLPRGVVCVCSGVCAQGVCLASGRCLAGGVHPLVDIQTPVKT